MHVTHNPCHCVISGTLPLLEGPSGPHLVVVPASLLDNWMRELRQWAPGLKVAVLYGPHREGVRDAVNECVCSWLHCKGVLILFCWCCVCDGWQCSTCVIDVDHVVDHVVDQHPTTNDRWRRAHCSGVEPPALEAWELDGRRDPMDAPSSEEEGAQDGPTASSSAAEGLTSNADGRNTHGCCVMAVCTERWSCWRSFSHGCMCVQHHALLHMHTGLCRAAPFDVMLTCYTLFERDSTEQKLDRRCLSKFAWSHVVLDEAHALKNAASARTRALRRYVVMTRLLQCVYACSQHAGCLMRLWH